MGDFLPEEKISEIREHASIVEVISDFVSLKKSGKNFLGLCPFHPERTPSFTVNEEKGIFHCFGCGAGGNIFSFMMRTHQLSFPEVVKELAKRYGINLPQRSLTDEEKRQKSQKGKLYEINELAVQYYHQILLSEKEGEDGRRYLTQRGISEKIIEEHRLGFAPAAWSSLGSFLQKKGGSLNLAETLGLILPRKEGAISGGPNFYDRFRRRIIFPIINEGGRICGFGGRILAEPAGDATQISPKYMNSPESPLYSKSRMLYGLNVAKGPIRESGSAVIVEGYMDLLSLHQEGIRNVVASLGTALTLAQLNLLRRFTQEVILIFDGDESGQKATKRSLDLFGQQGISAKVVSLPSDLDPDSFIRREKKAGFENLLSSALPVVEYVLEQAIKRNPSGSIEGKIRAVRELIPFLNGLKDPLEQNLYIERAASRLRLKESQILSQVRGRKISIQEEEKPSPKIPPGPAHEKLLLQLMLMRDRVIPLVEEVVGKDGFTDPRHRKLAREIITFWHRSQKMDAQVLLSQMDDEELKNLISELILAEESILDADRMLADCLRKVRLDRVHQEIKQVDEEIHKRSQQEKEESFSLTGLKELLKRKQRLIVEQKNWIADSALGYPPRAGQ